jgi:hypothetical protein
MRSLKGILARVNELSVRAEQLAAATTSVDMIRQVLIAGRQRLCMEAGLPEAERQALRAARRAEWSSDEQLRRSVRSPAQARLAERLIAARNRRAQREAEDAARSAETREE